MRKEIIMAEITGSTEALVVENQGAVPDHSRDVASPEARIKDWLQGRLEKPGQSDITAQEQQLNSNARADINDALKNANADLLGQETSQQKPTREQVMANALLSDEERLQAAENLLGPLSEIQKTTFNRMHEVGSGELGKDESRPAGVYNYTLSQIREKVRLGAEKTEDGKEIFNKKQRRILMEEGLVGYPDPLDPIEFSAFLPSEFDDDDKLSKIAKMLKTKGDAGVANEALIYRTITQIRRLDDAAEVDPLLAEKLLGQLEVWQNKADDELLPYDTRVRIERQAQEKGMDYEYNKTKAEYLYYKGLETKIATLSADLQIELRKRLESKHKEYKESIEKYAFWDRHWGSIVLTGDTQEELIRGVDSFLQIATNNQSNFDAKQYIDDGTRLNQEIQRLGKQVGMEQTEVSDLVARAEGTLFINAADYFAVRWNVDEWHQITSLVGRHIDTRLNAVSKAYDAEVIHAADILDNDKDYDQYSRQSRFASEEIAQNDQAAKSKRDEIQRKLEVRIALSQLKDIDMVIREHLVGIDAQTAFGFDINARNPDTGEPIPVIELFKNPQYLAEITRIDDKLKALNQKYAQGLVIEPTDTLTPEEQKLLALDRIRPCKKTADLVLIDQTDGQFRALYTEYGGFGTEADYKAEVQRLRDLGYDLLSIDEKRFLKREDILKRMENGDDLTDDELHEFPEISRAKQAVDLAIKTRDVFFISTEKACVSLKTRHNTAEGQGELLSYNDVVRLNKFVRERAIMSLPADIARAVTSDTRGGSGLMYVDIADKLEFRNLSNRVIREKGKDSEYGKNSQEALNLITLTEEEKKYEVHVQAVEDIQERVLEKLKEKGSALTVTEIDEIIKQVFVSVKINFDSGKTARNTQVQSVHRGKIGRQASIDYHDIINREDADPQYNFSMLDDQKYSSLLLSDEIKAAAYHEDHPHYNSIPATVRRVLDPDGTKLVRKGDPDVEREDAFRVQETQRRFHFAVDSVKVFGALYSPDLYDEESKKPTIADVVINIRNAPFIGRRMIDQRAWTLWNRGQAYRGRGFLKYLESNFKALDHSTGVRGLRGVVASYNGFREHGFNYKVNFSGALDELKTELWLGQAKGADAVRTVLVGGRIAQDPNPFEGIFKKIVKTIGRNNSSYQSVKGGQSWASSPLSLIANKKWDQMYVGDFEKAIDEIEDRWKRVTTYGDSLAFVGNTSQVPLAAKFSGDTAIRRMVYWAIAHPEAESAYNINMDLTRVILQPLMAENGRTLSSYFGKGKTLFDELLRRAVLMK